MAVKFALDTNVIVYAEGVDDTVRQASALQILSGVPRDLLFISVQVVGELFNVLTKRQVPRLQALERALYWKRTLSVVDTTQVLMDASLELANEHRLRIWDAIMLAAASEARCEFLLSEDFQEGFVWRGVTIINPFAAKLHPALKSALRV